MQQQANALGNYSRTLNETGIAVMPEPTALVTGHPAPEPASYSAF